MRTRASAISTAFVATALLAAQATAASGRGPLPEWVELGDHGQARPAVPADYLRIAEDRAEALAASGIPAVDLVQHFEIEKLDDGHYRETFVLVRRFLSEEGLAQYGNVSVGVATERQTARVHRAYSIAPDGSHRKVSPDAYQIAQSQSTTVFSDQMVLVVPFTSLRIGSTAVLEVSITSDERDWPLPWSRVFTMQSSIPIERFEVEARWSPGTTPLHHAANDAGIFCIGSPGPVLRCSRFAIPAVDFSTSLEGWADLLPELVIEEPQSWSDIASAEMAVMAKSSRPDDSTSALAAELIAGLSDDDAMLERVHRFVSDEIRYVAFEHGSSAIVPRPADVTLSRRFGDCKDKVALFIALARSAGLEAFPVLVSSSRYDPERLAAPAWSYFDHMIACVRPAGSKSPDRRCFELTVPGAHHGSLPVSLEGAVALELLPDTGQPTTLPDSEPGWSANVDVLQTLECDGRLVERGSVELGGGGGQMLRSQLRQSPPLDRETWARNELKAALGLTRAPKVAVQGVEGSGPLLRIAWERSQAIGLDFDRVGEYATYDGWLYYLGRSFQPQTTTHRYRHPGLVVRSRYQIEVCSDAGPRFSGPDLEFESRFGSLLRRSRTVGDRAVVHTSLEIERALMPPEDLGDFTHFLDASLLQTSIWLRFQSRGKP
ncbi:MAG: DUF3857 domain-containing transglutaminase family protein [Myxococcota bacterium]